MSNLLTGSQMRAVETAAMAAGECSGAVLMERAAAAVVDEVFRSWPELCGMPAPRAAILCGPGNNGGDGFVIARRLAERGWRVDAALFGDSDRLSGDAARAHALWTGFGPVLAPCDLARRRAEAGAPDLAVDALFGTGLTRPVAGAIGDVLSDLLSGARRRVAVDIASGLCADSGRLLRGPSDAARGAPPLDLVVSFHTAKPGHLLAEGGGIGARLAIADIGLDPARDADRAGGPVARAVTRADCGPAAVKSAWAHKYGHGHAFVLTGGAGRTGAARMAGRAALRIGAGLVTLGVPPAAQMEVACQVTALMLARLPDAEALADLLADPRYTALCLGPALGLDDRARALVETALGAGRATVLDADALSLFADAPERLFACTAGQPVVLTPHGGEFKRLFPDLAGRLAEAPVAGPAFSRLDAVREAAARAGCVVLLKGADTVIAAPDGAARIHAALRDRACPWMATAGAGDVLAGIITGLLARGHAPLDAAAMAAWLHVEAGRHVGPGLIAEDLPEALPAVLATLAEDTPTPGA